MMDFMDLVKQRYSERAFDSRPLEQDKLDLILEAGRLAPTGCNYQPQRFYVLKSEASLTIIRGLTSCYNAPLMILVCYDTEAAADLSNLESMREHYDLGEQDASIAAASMMFEAENLGVHSIWIRGFDSAKVSDAFHLPENIIPVMLLGLGYPSERSKPSILHTKRNPIDSFVTIL